MATKELWKKRIKYAVKNNDRTLDKLAENLEVLEIIKNNPQLVWWVCCYDNAYEMIIDRPAFMLGYSTNEVEKQFNIVKEWLERK